LREILIRDEGIAAIRMRARFARRHIIGLFPQAAIGFPARP
jgi:hypothetical protein